jgi:hypothetical protein
VRPGNSWDLRSCRQQPGESLREYIWRFSKQRSELPNITDSDVIGAFLAGTTCCDLVSKLGRKCHTRFQGVEPSAYHMCARIHFHTYVDVTSVIYQKTMQ